VPVDADSAKANALCDDTESDRVDGAIKRPPVCGNAVKVAATSAPLHLWVSIVLNAPIAGRDFDGLAELVPDELKLISQLLLNHLRAATAGALKLIPAEIFCQRGLIPCFERDDGHWVSSFHKKSFREVYTTLNATKYLAGLRIVDTNKSPDKVTFVITIKHADGITYKATCVFNYNSSKVWTVTVTKI
jgi:hypothetical protein